jgi:hypothetical protein
MLTSKNNKLKVKGTKKTFLFKILDRSGSMASIEANMRDLFNENLKTDIEGSKIAGETYMTVILFDDKIETLIDNAKVNELEGTLDKSQYFARGSTALYDAIGTAINMAKKLDNGGDTGFLFEIYSDGGENCSTEFNDGKALTALIQSVKDTGRYTFQFLGCEDNCIKEAQNLGFSTFYYSKSAAGVNNLSGTIATSKAAYYGARSTGTTSVDRLINSSGDNIV